MRKAYSIPIPRHTNILVPGKKPCYVKLTRLFKHAMYKVFCIMVDHLSRHNF